MNITYIIGVVAAILVFLLGCVLGINLPPEAGQEVVTFTPGNLWNFFDAASIFIVIGCTFAIVVASFPGDTLGYAIGVAQPTSIMVSTFGTGKVSNERLDRKSVV